MKLWLDVDDLFYFAERSARPTGIQRLTGEVYAALMEVDPGRIGFVRHGEPPGNFRVVNWSEVHQVYTAMTTGAVGKLGSQKAGGPEETAISQARSLPAYLRLLRQLFSRQVEPSAAPSPSMSPGTPGHSLTSDLRAHVKPGDVFCSLGAPWHNEAYANHVSQLVSDTGVRFAMLVHDLIPLLCPEFFEAGRAPHFGKLMMETLPLADVLLTNSQSTARDVSRWAKMQGIALKCEPHHVPVGAGFARPPAGPLPPGLEPGSFVLFVSTIEIRKNHLQAFRVWCRMLHEMPRDSVPTLVFAGAVGWMVGDLMKAIESTNRLDGKLVLIHEPDDATLCALYQACRFTLFMSHYEGWGLPVSDSLAFRKICIASNKTAIPEAGGDFCPYVDPDNTTGAYELIRQLIENPNELMRLEERLRTQYKPVLWSTTARAVIEAVS